MKIFLIEDNIDSNKSLCRYLTWAGYEVESATSAEEAIEALKEVTPDFVISDLGLPGMSGCDLVQIVKAYSHLQSAIFVCVTGYQSEEDHDQCMKSGFDLVLGKPLCASELELAMGKISRTRPLPARDSQPKKRGDVVAMDSTPPTNVAGHLLFVDNDPHQVGEYVHALTDTGFRVTSAGSAAQAVYQLKSHAFDAVILDIMMPSGRRFTPGDTAGGARTGLALAREIRSTRPSIPLIALTYSQDPTVIDWFKSDRSLEYFYKAATKPRQFARLVKRFLKLENAPLKAFIVHGRDLAALRELKDFLQNTLKIGEPIVLGEQASQHRTIIEKFEYYAADVDIVFVLFTPDDFGQVKGWLSTRRKRARQNVIFEYGYFLGSLRRHSGRVILLHKGPCELPSDVSGIVYIYITNGVTAAGEIIRRELSAWVR
jgi:CheY-like chemotaxis protein